MTMTTEKTPGLTPECPEPEDFKRRQAAGQHAINLLRQARDFTDAVEAEGNIVLGEE